MVHALEEAHRVLKPAGALIDVRPAPVHRQLGTGMGRTWRFVGRLHEPLDDDHAADAAIAEVLRRGLFRRESHPRFLVERVMDTPEEVAEFLAEFDERRKLASHSALLARLQRQIRQRRQPRKFAIRGPMHLAVLMKNPTAPARTQTEVP